MQIRFQPDAETELAEARVWYALHREGLDDALTKRIDETLRRIARVPYACDQEKLKSRVADEDDS